MELTLRRIANVLPTAGYRGYCIGHLYADGQYLCDTLEPFDRKLDLFVDASGMAKNKVIGQTAIPLGRYQIDFNTWSYRFGNREFYRHSCCGMPPRLMDVPCFDGVIVHVGNYPHETDGCILVGRNTQKGAVLESKETFKRVYRVMKEEVFEGRDVFINIIRSY